MISLPRKSKNTKSPQYRIVVPTPLYGGSLPIALHAAEAFQELGHDVLILRFDTQFNLYESLGSSGENSSKLKGRFAELLSDHTVEYALAEGAELVWYTAQCPITIPGLKRLNNAGIRTALWFVEDVRRFDYWRYIAPHMDIVFTIQVGDAARTLEIHGARKVVYLPCAANPRVHRPQNLNASDQSRYGSIVSFVGAGYPNRVRLFDELNIKELRVWGNDWPASWKGRLEDGGRRVTAEETALIYSASDINLNIHSEVNGVLLSRGDFVNPRTFEIAACRGFQIVNAQEPLPALFTEEEVAVVNTVDELRSAIDYYRANPGRRQEMATKAHARVMREHTYVQRMKTALNAVLAPGETAIAGASRQLAKDHGQYSMKDLIEASWGDEDMLQFLSQFDPNEPATLDRLITKLPAHPRELSRSEKLVLLMKEFRQWGIEKGVIV